MRVDDDEAEDYYYRWRAIGQMLGIDPAAIPPDLAAARELTDLITGATTAARTRGSR